MFSRWTKNIPLGLVMALLMALGLARIGLAYVTTDQQDYAPGSVVTISGDNSDNAGYQAGETVHVDVTGPNYYTSACDATVGDNGAWSCQVTLASDLSAVGEYTYTATGQYSHVSQTGSFTDDPPQALVTVTASPEDAIGGTFTIQRVQTSGKIQVSGGTTTQTFAVQPSSSFSISNIESPFNGCNYSGPATVTGTAGEANTTTTVTLTYSCAISTTTTASNASAIYGETVVTLSATVSPNPGGGSVSFFVNGSPAGSGSVGTGGVATVNYDPSSMNVNTYTIRADFGGYGSYSASSSDPSHNGTLTINQAPSTTIVTVSNATYDGYPHGGTASVTGAGGLNQSLTVSYVGRNGTVYGPSTTAPTNAGDYTASASFAGDTNHTGSSDSKDFTISKADATCTVTGYNITYDGNAHTATGSCIGVMGESLTGLDLSGTEHINAGSYTDSWTFTDVTGNYNNDNGTISDNIAKANASCTVTGYSVTYDGNAHTATGSCTGVKGESLTGLDLSGTTHTNPGDYLADPWTFIDGTGNYKDTSGTVHDNIHYATGGMCYGAPGHQILQPINADGTSVFKQKSTVPAKFRVCDAYGNSIGTPGVVSTFRLVQTISGTVVDTVDEAVDSTTPDTAFRWSATDQQWIFNINTKYLAANKTYVYLITLNDGSTIKFQFGLK
jgi:hypothetical protein